MSKNNLMNLKKLLFMLKIKVYPSTIQQVLLYPELWLLTVLELYKGQPHEILQEQNHFQLLKAQKELFGNDFF